MKEPFFSIVLITYNRADLLPRCIDSVVSQSFDDWELIIVDNHSEDGTKELVDAYMAKDKRIKFIQVHNHNVLAVSRNAGIKLARGKYVCSLDSDDWYTKDKLQVVYDVCINTPYDVLYSKFQLMSKKEEGKICGKPLTSAHPFMELLVKGNIICNTTTVIKREAWESVGYMSEDPGLTAVEDIDGFLKLASTHHTFHFIDKPLVYYWVGDNNMSFSSKQIQRATNLFNKWLPEVEECDKELVIGGRDYLLGRMYHKIRDWENARLCYLRVLKSSKSVKKQHAFFLLICSILHISL